MYCAKCGTEIADDASFCSKCGYATNGAAPAGGYAGGIPYGGYAPYATPLKSAGLAAILSFLFTGLGQVYLGKITRGICFIIIGIAISSVMFAIMLPLAMAGSGGAFIPMVVAAIVSAVVWIYNVFDAYTLAEEYNNTLRRTGNPPW
ncbi:zinc ribbon domain-containing protein [Candidatus Methanomassiliicoccus intestinalis]|uniref:zinc ribbon domain-containing protein n=1 Tax=Candidatus Methanomassiliicoccus intestinalis TaxID=1406512 RepID=UPI0037DD3E73